MVGVTKTIGGEMKLNAREWLNDLEFRIRPKFAGVSLVVEANIDPSDAARALKAFGAAYRGTHSRLTASQRLSSGNQDPLLEVLFRWPASLAFALVSAATTGYGRGTYWPRVLEAANLTGYADVQTHLGRAFLRALDRLSLPKFPQLELTYLGPILMHAGIPNSSLEDLLNLLVARRDLDPGIDGPSFLAWGLDAKATNRFASIDVPVRNFLRDGGEFALDIVERLLEILEYVDIHRDPVALAELTSETTGLPEQMVGQLVRLVEDSRIALDRMPSRAQVDRLRSERPKVVLDWAHGALMVALPPVKSTSGHVSWKIAVDGRLQTVESSARWLGDDQETSAKTINIDRPAQRISVTNTETDRQSDLTLVDPSDPLLLFDDDGDMLAAATPISSGRVWALWPAADATLVDESEAEVKVLVDDEPPAGWTGWRLTQMDVAGLQSVRLNRASGPGRQRLVRQDELPLIQLASPIPGILTLQGLPVFGHVPKLQLPTDRAGKSTKWDIRVFDSRRPEPIVEHRGVALDAVRGFDLFEGVQRPVIGTLTVQVRGPLGRKVSRTFAVAEGFSMVCDPGLRRFTTAGLQPALVLLHAPQQVLVDHAMHEFDSKTVERVISGRARGTDFAFVVSPPRVETFIDSPDAPANWIPGLARLNEGMLVGGSQLAVRVPGEEGQLTLQLRTPTGETQTLRPASRKAGAPFRYSLASIADTIKRCVRAELFVQADDQSILVGTVRPRLFASAAVPAPGGIDLLDYSPAPGIRAAVYAHTAPWLKPEICEVDDNGRIELSRDLGDTGDLSIHLAEDDGWGGVEWPSWPVGSQLIVRRPGYRRSDDEAEDRLSHMLGDPEFREPLRDSLSILDKLWATLTIIDDIPGPYRGFAVNEIRLALCADPDRSLRALSGESHSPAVQTKLLIRSQVVEQRFVKLAITGEVRTLRVGGLDLAALAAIPAVIDDGLIDLDEVLADLQVIGGVDLLEILQGKPDRSREAARFDSTAKQLGHFRKAELDQIWLSAQIVPEGLLHVDSRVVAARELFDRRNDKGLSAVQRNVADEVRRLKAEIRRGGLRRVNDQLDARLDVGATPEVWQFLPALSFCYAVRARLEAWLPHLFGPLPTKSRALWMDLAFAAPSFARMDIVLADALIAASMQRARPEA